MAFIMKEGVLDTYLPEKGESVVTIPAGVHTIQEHAFDEVLSLEELIVPEGVRRIGNAAFARCKNLKKVTLPKSLECIDDDAFVFCESLTEILVPEKANIRIGSVFSCTPWLDQKK